MIPFFPLFMNDCFVSLIGVSLFFSFFLFWEPDLFGNCDNLIFANPLSTPHHILPEWYFLIFYSCLRAFPNKTMGVIMVLLLFILLFLLLDCLRIACQDQFKCYRVFSSSYWENRIFTMTSYWVHNTIVGRVRSIVIQLGHPIINEHTITLHFDRYIYSRNYFGPYYNLNNVIQFPCCREILYVL